MNIKKHQVRLTQLKILSQNKNIFIFNQWKHIFGKRTKNQMGKTRNREENSTLSRLQGENNFKFNSSRSWWTASLSRWLSREQLKNFLFNNWFSFLPCTKVYANILYKFHEFIMLIQFNSSLLSSTKIDRWNLFTFKSHKTWWDLRWKLFSNFIRFRFAVWCIFECFQCSHGETIASIWFLTSFSMNRKCNEYSKAKLYSTHTKLTNHCHNIFPNCEAIFYHSFVFLIEL